MEQRVMGREKLTEDRTFKRNVKKNGRKTKEIITKKIGETIKRKEKDLSAFPLLSEAENSSLRSETALRRPSTLLEVASQFIDEDDIL
jgi:hypothetical protein